MNVYHSGVIIRNSVAYHTFSALENFLNSTTASVSMRQGITDDNSEP